jgi:hypothetical protein
MPNGFHGPKDEWQRMEAPYVRIDPILTAFAQRHGRAVVRNYRDADRGIRFNDALSRAIWIGAMDKYGTSGMYQVSIIAHQDRPVRYIKAARVGDPVAVDDLDRMLERATTLVLSWTEGDLELPSDLPARDRPETERIY